MKHFYLSFASKITYLGLLTAFIFSGFSNGQSVATFENLLLSKDSYWTDTEEIGGFTNGNAYFYSNYYPSWGGWGGFIYSNSTDITTNSYTNDFSAITGAGYRNSSNYAVAYGSAGIKLLSTQTVSGFFATNTTYTALTLKEGGSFMGKKFGGEDGTDPDFFILTVYGYLDGQKKTDSVNFYLADFRSPDSNEDYIVDSWEWIDLKSLGDIDSLSFDYTTTDFNDYGPITPTYFAMDNFGDETITSNQLASTFNWQVFPNPAQDILHVSLPTEISNGTIQVRDLSGILLIDQPIIHGIENTIPLNNLKTGAYILTIQSDRYNSVKTFLKQ